MTEVWILGGTGRSGRAIAAELRKRDIRPVLVGRDAKRLAEAAKGDEVVVAASVDDLAAEIGRRRPAVVVNTVGPFSATAAPLARACLPASTTSTWRTTWPRSPPRSVSARRPRPPAARS
ncbi:NAD(P)H-binding protein [Actinophytocola gossypii]|uniref:NAD(P)H-binding protein n=1 Tax=Actinophytocola gossypii TaxID=2812003 RepID=UPI0021A47068|nr:NAD(P)H-binding protein [Actinophytocola gossypii]